MRMNMLRTTALTMALGFSLGGCESMRTAAYAGGGAAAAGALGAGIGYIASKGNVQTTAIAGAASAVGGAVIGGAIAGAGKRAKEKQREEGYQLGVSDAVKRQYWIARSLQMAKHNDAESPYQTRYYTFNIQPDPQANINRVPYNVTIPVLE
jgi:hypothetical protein